MVQEGQVRRADKRGSDSADTAADKGATESQQKVHLHGSMYCSRHEEYRTFMCRIQHFIVGLKEEERRLKQEAAKQKEPLQKNADRLTAIPRSLRYPGMDASSDGGQR